MFRGKMFKPIRKILRFFYSFNLYYYLLYKGRFRVFRCYSVSIARKAGLILDKTSSLYISIPEYPRKKVFGELRLGKEAELSVHGSVWLTMPNIWVLKKGKLTLGDGLFINYESTILCEKQITIADDVMIGRGAWITDSDGHPVDGREDRVSLPVVIGRHVWIGSRATILKGVTIGSGSIVAQGAVVTKDVPERCLVAGVPARVMRENVEWER